MPRKTVSAALRNRTLLNMNALSLDRKESKRFSLFRSSSLRINIPKEKRRINPIKPRKNGPMSD